MGKADYKKLYVDLKKKDHTLQECPVTRQTISVGRLEPHHPMGRRGKWLCAYFWVAPAAHRRIHNEPAWARENMLLGDLSSLFTPDIPDHIVAYPFGLRSVGMEILPMFAARDLETLELRFGPSIKEAIAGLGQPVDKGG